MRYYEIIGKIESINRLNCSYYGNPRFNVIIGDYTLTTKSDYSYSYNIENLFRKQCIVKCKVYDTKKSIRIETIKELKNVK